jgi:hypothetical protein
VDDRSWAASDGSVRRRPNDRKLEGNSKKLISGFGREASIRP